MRNCLLFALCAFLAACEAVPDVTFAPADAGHDAARDDAGQALDAEVPDAPVDDASSDGEAAVGCPSAIPAGATTCCGAVACYGPCPPGDCNKCATTCAGPRLVCCTSVKLTCQSLDNGPCP